MQFLDTLLDIDKNFSSSFKKIKKAKKLEKNITYSVKLQPKTAKKLLCSYVKEIEFPVTWVSMSIAFYFWPFIGKMKGPLKSSIS